MNVFEYSIKKWEVCYFYNVLNLRMKEGDIYRNLLKG